MLKSRQASRPGEGDFGGIGKLPPPQGQDLRIDEALTEIMAANEASDYKSAAALSLELAEKAKQQGAA